MVMCGSMLVLSCRSFQCLCCFGLENYTVVFVVRGYCLCSHGLRYRISHWNVEMLAGDVLLCRAV